MDENGIDKIILESYVKAIDNKDIDKIKKLNNDINIINDNKDIDIVLEIYNKKLLSSERLEFLIKNQSRTSKITPKLIRRLLNCSYYEFYLLNIIFNHLLNIFDFDNESIMELLLHYKNRTPMAISALKGLVEQYDFSQRYNGRGMYEIDYASNWIHDKWLHLRQCIYKACSIGNLRFVKYLANELGIDIKGSLFTEHDFTNTNTYEGEVLWNACSGGNEKLVRWLIHYGFDVNKESNYGMKIPLLSACRKGYQHLVELLVKSGADINKANKTGDTPLFCAWWSGNESLVKWLIEHGAEINKTWGYYTSTLLTFACSRAEKNEDFIKYLVDHGANIKQPWVLFYLCRQGKDTLVQWFVDHGADIHQVNERGETVLFNACWSGNENLVIYLIDHGLDIHKFNRDGETPLFYACRSGNDKLVKYLVEKKSVDFNKVNGREETAIFYACRSGNNTMVNYLMECGANVNKKNKKGQTPLSLLKDKK